METPTFQAFTLAHFLPIVFILLIGIVGIIVAKKSNNDSVKIWIGVCLACIATLGVFLRFGYLWSIAQFDYREELPLHLCRLLALAAPIVMYTRNRKWMGIFYFLIYAGTLQANLTPDLNSGFPLPQYFAYWMMHSGLLILPMYCFFVYRMKINFLDFKQAFIVSNIYLLGITAINWLIGANYFYTIKKPASASLLDFFGPWPIYVFVTWCLGIFLFVLLYLPFYKRK